MIAKRRRLLNFLEKIDKKRATDILKKVGLGKENASEVAAAA
jgi:ribosomal protein S15P/S13E